jgi:hypothetical protein
MCGYSRLPGGSTIWIDCILVEFPWHHPWPPVDFTRISLENLHVAGPSPEPWKVELTAITQMLSLAGQLRDTDQANRIAETAVEAGNAISKEAGIDIEFGWDAHAG